MRSGQGGLSSETIRKGKDTMEAYRTKRDALPDFRIRLFLITLGFFMASVFFVHQAEKLVIQQAVRQYAGIAQQYSHSLRKSG
jgi:HEPN domain-containing protein